MARSLRANHSKTETISEIKMMISKYDLSEEQWEQVSELANDTQPQGQFFWIEGEIIFVGDHKNQGFEMWIAQGGDPESLIDFSLEEEE